VLWGAGSPVSFFFENILFSYYVIPFKYFLICLSVFIFTERKKL